MTSSSDHRTPSSPRPGGEHWHTLTATLSAQSTEEFSTWLSLELKVLEEQLDKFVTPNSLLKSLRR